MASIGTLEWAAATHGELRPADQARFAGQAVRGQVRELWSRLFSRPPEQLVRREPPLTPLTRKVLGLVDSIYPAELLEHTLRCWWWAALLAAHDGLEYDEELLYVSCLLHDVALIQVPSTRCFAVQSGRFAGETLMSYGASESLATRAAEAITLHMNVELPTECAPEARLLHDAAHLDVVGSRVKALPRQAIREVLERHPRNDFTSSFLTAMRHEARERPRSRAALSWWLGMRLPATFNPLDRGQ